MELALPSAVEDALHIVSDFEVASATWGPGEGTDTRLNCSCAFSSYSGHANVELDYIPSKKTLQIFAVQFRRGLRTVGTTWRPGEGTDTRLWHCCRRTESNAQFGGPLDAIQGVSCTLHI